MAPEFWTFSFQSNEIGEIHTSIWSPDHFWLYTGWCDHPAKWLGQFFLDYAYSTPAGVAYRLAYGIGKE